MLYSAKFSQCIFTSRFTRGLLVLKLLYFFQFASVSDTEKQRQCGRDMLLSPRNFMEIFFTNRQFEQPCPLSSKVVQLHSQQCQSIHSQVQVILNCALSEFLGDQSPIRTTVYTVSASYTVALAILTIDECPIW